MRFRVGVKGPSPVTVVLEPTGAEYVLQPGDYYEFESLGAPGPLIGTIDHEPGMITIGEETVARGCGTRMGKRCRCSARPSLDRGPGAKLQCERQYRCQRGRAAASHCLDVDVSVPVDPPSGNS